MASSSPSKADLQDEDGDRALDTKTKPSATTTAAMSPSQSRSRRSPPPRSPPPRDRYRGRDRSPRGPPSDWRNRDYRTRSPPPRNYPRGGRYERSRDWNRDKDRDRDRDRGRRYDDDYDPPPRRPPGSPPRGYRSPPRRSSYRSPSPPPRGGAYIATRMSDTPRGSRDDRYSHRRSRSPPPRRSPSPRYRRSYRRGSSRSPPRQPRRSSRPRSRSPRPRRRSPPPHAASSDRVLSHSRSTSEVGAKSKDRSVSGASPPSSPSKEDASSPAKEEPIQIKEEPVDGPMDLDRASLPLASVKRERSSSPVKAQPSSPERNQDTSSSSGAGPSSDRPPKPLQTHERRLPPTGPRGGRGREGEWSPRSVKAESPTHPSVHKLKQEPSPFHRQNEGSMSPAVSSPHPSHHSIPTGPSSRTGKPIPSGPRAANRAAVPPPSQAATVRTEPEKPKVRDIEIPNRRRDWSYLPSHREREILSQKLLAQQKVLQDLALEVIRSGWDLDVHGIELEGLKEKRDVAEKMFERASQGLTQDEAVDQNPAAQLKPSRAGSAVPPKIGSAATPAN